MKENTHGSVCNDVRTDTARNSDPVSVQDMHGTGSRTTEYTDPPEQKSGQRPSLLIPIRARLAELLNSLLGDASDKGSAARRHAVRTRLRLWLSVLGTFLAALLFSSAALGYETYPLGLAFVCAAGSPLLLGVSALGQTFSVGCDAQVLYLGGMTAALGMRYAVGRYLTPDPDAFGASHSRRRDRVRRRGTDPAAVDDTGGTLARIGRALFPSGVFSQSIAVRVGISVLAAAPVAIGYLLGDASGTPAPAIRALFIIAAVPVFTYLFCGFSDGTACAPALREAGIGAVCYAVTVSCGGVMLLGFSVRQLCAHAITLYISKKYGYLRGAVAGLLCGCSSCHSFSCCGRMLFRLYGCVCGSTDGASGNDRGERRRISAHPLSAIPADPASTYFCLGSCRCAAYGQRTDRPHRTGRSCRDARTVGYSVACRAA